MKHEESLLCPCRPNFDLDGLHHREPPGGAVTRDELVDLIFNSYHLDIGPLADRILARFTVHHLPAGMPRTEDARPSSSKRSGTDG